MVGRIKSVDGATTASAMATSRYENRRVLVALNQAADQNEVLRELSNELTDWFFVICGGCSIASRSQPSAADVEIRRGPVPLEPIRRIGRQHAATDEAQVHMLHAGSSACQ